MAARAENTIVSIVTLKPSDSPDTTGRTVNNVLAAMQIMIRPARKRSFLAGGIMIARNMP